MRILVTGGTGHLGAWLVKSLSDLGHEVVVLCRNPDSVDYLNFKGVALVKGDILNPKSIAVAMDGVVQVYHLAAFAEVWAKDNSIYYQMNVEGTRNLLEAAKNFGVQKVVVTSSAGNFGPSFDGEITETIVREVPFYTLYEKTKDEADNLALEYAKAGMNLVLVYPTRVYGPVLSGKPASLTLLLRKMHDNDFRIVPGSGKKLGNYVFVDDITKGFILAMEHGKSCEKYILGGENHTLTDFYKQGFKVLGRNKMLVHIPLPLIRLIVFIQYMGTWFGKKPTLTSDWLKKILLHWKVNSAKAQHELGYTITPLEEGIRKTLNSFK